MSPVIRVSDKTWERLQNKAKPFIDQPEDVINRLLDFNEKYDSITSTSNEIASTVDRAQSTAQKHVGTVEKSLGTSEESLKSRWLTLGQASNESLTKEKPKAVKINGEKQSVRDWTEAMVKFFNYLISNGSLKQTDVPLHDASGNKYILNTEPNHEGGKWNGKWHSLKGSNYYVNTKYEANKHTRNMLSVLSQLNLRDLNVELLLAKNSKTDNKYYKPKKPRPNHDSKLRTGTIIEHKVNNSEPEYLNHYRGRLPNPKSMPSLMLKYIESEGPIVDRDQLKKDLVNRYGYKGTDSGSFNASIKILEVDGYIRTNGKSIIFVRRYHG